MGQCDVVQFGYTPGEMTVVRHASAIVVGLILAGSLTLARQSAPPISAAPQEPSGRGRGGPPVQGAEEDTPLVDRFDRNRDKRLDRDERAAAREYLTAHPELRRPAVRPRITRTGTPGVPLAPKDVEQYGEKVSLYDAATLR